MTQLPRVEITEKALKVLKIETALSGLPQKTALEALILRGASSRSLALMEEKPLMEFKTLGECVENKPKVECLKEGEAIICAPRQVAPEARQALSFILSELEAGREPTTREVAEKVQMTQVGISRKLGELGVSSQNTKRQMKPVRIYPRHLKDKIEEILKSD